MPRFVPEDIADLINRMLTIDIDKRITTPELKFHRCFLNENGVNMYFPVNPSRSYALEFMETHPIIVSEFISWMCCYLAIAALFRGLY